MQVPLSGPITSNEICYASYISQASLGERSMPKLAEKLLEVALDFFQGNHFSTLIKNLTKDAHTSSISCFHDNYWGKFYLHVPSAQQSLINDNIEQRIRRLETNNEIRTCISLCTVVLSQALLKGHNTGVLQSENNPAIFAITPETVVLNLLAEVDSECAFLPNLAATKAIKALVLRFFESNVDLSSIPEPRRNSPLASKWIWTTQFQGKVALPQNVEKSRQRIRDINQAAPREHPNPVKSFLKWLSPPNRDVNAMNVLYVTFPVPM